MKSISVNRKSSKEEVNALFEKSDIVSLHCPLTPETENMIGAAEIQRMKSGVLIVNTARGKLIDKSALRDGLKSGTLSSCVLWWG